LIDHANAIPRDSPVVPNKQWKRARREGYEINLPSFAENALDRAGQVGTSSINAVREIVTKKRTFVVAICLMIGLLPFRTTLGATHEEVQARTASGEHWAKLDHITLHYQISGKGPLVVIQAPGWGIGAEYLEKGLAPLQQHFTVLAYDPRGTGQSTPVSASDHLKNSDLAQDLEQLRIYCGLDRMDLVAHSNGSAIAILYAELHPERVHKLVLIGSQLLGYHGEKGPDAIAEDARRKNDPQFAIYIARMHAPAPDTDQGFTEQFKQYAGFFFYNPSKDVPILLSSMTHPMSVSMNKAFKESPAATEAPPLSDLEKITAATLIVDGRQDPACPFTESERIHAGISGSTLLAIDQSGHFPWIEQPSESFPPVVAFLKL
jgi:proline iminopeptidase